MAAVVVMKVFKVGLVQINNVFFNSCYFPYSIGLLQAYFQKNSSNKDLFSFLKPVFYRISVAQAVSELIEADIVAFSAYTWNFRISLEIAKQLKKVNPGVFVIFGGPHVPDRAESFLRQYPFIDLACHGEGEETFTAILDNFPTKNFEDIPSISYLSKDKKWICNPRGKRIEDLSLVPSPYLEGVFDDLLMMDLPFDWVGLWETNRGCPFSCAYCDWGSATQAKMFTFDMKRLRAEAEWFATHKIEFIFCCDSNFGLLPRDLDIVDIVVQLKKEYGYPQALSVQNTKNATERSYTVQKNLSAAGLNKGVTMALQTVDQTALVNVGRKNISLKSFEELQQRFNRDNIETYTDLILGLPGETYDSFLNGVSSIIANGQHNRIQFINLSILPNAKMGDPDYQKKHGIIITETKTINHHGTIELGEDGIEETQVLVIGTQTMPCQDWRKARVFSWMCSFLYFDKILQIPLLLLHKLGNCSLREMIERFLFEDQADFPILSEMNQFFMEEAKNIQQGGPEYFPSQDWLNIHWPHDEFVFIKLAMEGKLDSFYLEAKAILSRLIEEKGLELQLFLEECLILNRYLIKQPFQERDQVVNLNYDIWETYVRSLTADKVTLAETPKEYKIDRTSEIWGTWNDWLKEVVWYGNKKGAYLYKLKEL